MQTVGMCGLRTFRPPYRLTSSVQHGAFAPHYGDVLVSSIGTLLVRERSFTPDSPWSRTSALLAKYSYSVLTPYEQFIS